MLKKYCEIAVFEDILKRGSSLRVKVTGRSMVPFLNDGEFVTIKKVPPHALRKGNLIFFKNSQGTPLLHRIIQRRKSFDHKIIFRTKGDALIAFDEPVQYQNVLGKVIRIEKRNFGLRLKTINMESFQWRAINAMVADISRFRSYFLARCVLRVTRFGFRAAVFALRVLARMTIPVSVRLKGNVNGKKKHDCRCLLTKRASQP